ncbi:YciI family protein [Streptomyces sp. NPDC059118]|uniref:YciI family protein n=1 Tax=unclassified Streptomyces TaxID=2593676 RepID=UPI00367E0C3C
MKFLLNVYLDPADPGAPALWAHARPAHEEAFARIVGRSGELVDGQAFADPSTNTVVRVRDGVLRVTEGPYPGTAAHADSHCVAESGSHYVAEAGGRCVAHARSYYVLDCENLARAVELAALHPAARLDAVEVRPLMAPAGWEM